MDIDKYKSYLISEEKSNATIEKYIHDVEAFINWLGGRAIKRELVIRYKNALKTKYEASSVNTILSSLSSYFDWIGHPEYKVKNLKIQKDTFFSLFSQLITI